MNRTGPVRRACQAAAFVLLAAAVSPEPGRAQDADWAQVVAAAKREGSLVVYSGIIATLTRPAIAAFEKAHGIRVEILEPRPSEIRERIRAEQAAGRFNGDLTLGSFSTLTLQARDGAFQPHGALPAAARLPDGFKDDGTIVPNSVNLFSMLVNTEMVPAAEIPKSWQNVVDPKWREKIIMDDPRANGAGHVTFAALYKRFGRDFVEKLAAQKPAISREIAVNERRVGRGEYPMYIPQLLANLPTLKGLPVAPVIPEEGAAYIVFAGAALKNAPHPNAARLFLDFLLSDEVQDANVRQGFRSPTGYVSAGLDPMTKAFASAPLLGTSPPDEQEAMLKLAAEIFR